MRRALEGAARRRGPPAPEIPHHAAAGATVFREGVLFESWIATAGDLRDPDGARALCDLHATVEALGLAALRVLSASRFLRPSDPDFADLERRALSETRNQRVAVLMQTGAVRSPRRPWQDARHCWLRLRDESVTVGPTRRVGADGWRQLPGPPQDIQAPLEAAATGAALREGFTRSR